MEVAQFWRVFSLY